MPEAIGIYSPEAIIEAIEQNLVDAAVALGRTENGVVFRGSDVSWVYTGYPALNRILRAKFNDDEAEDRVAEIAECFHHWNAPVVWVTGPSTWPPQLPDYLHESGFRQCGTWMGMATDLATLPQLADASGKLRVEPITEIDDLKSWTLLNTARWPDEATAGALHVFSPQNAGRDPRCRFYLGYLNDKPAVRAMLCISDAVAGLYWLDASPASQDAGFEQTLALRALNDARVSGAKISILLTRDPQSALCTRLGFKPYCQFTDFAWPTGSNKAPIC